MIVECSVVKRNGSKVTFDQGKIASAVEEAFYTDNVTDLIVDEVVDKVLDYILDSGTTIISTESINDHVERAFMALGHYTEAKNFIVYREQNKNIRKIATDNDTMSEYIFMNRYSRYLPRKKRRETWNEAVDRVRDMHIEKYPMAEESILWAFEQVRQKRVLPSMRSMQFGGKPIEEKNARMYNCFSEDVEFITSRGIKSFEEYNDGDNISVLTHTGSFKDAIVKEYPISDLNEISFKKGNSNEYTCKATEDHSWILSNGDRTTSLQVGDSVIAQPNTFNDWEYESATIDEKMYWGYGLVYGDGTKVKDKNGEYKHSMIRLCGDDIKYCDRFIELGFKTSTNNQLNGDFYAYTGTYLKTLPTITEDIGKLRAFVRGLLDADGEKNKNYNGNTNANMFHSIQQTSNITQEFIENVFPMVGVYITSQSVVDRDTNFGTHDAVKFKINTACHHTSAKWKVTNIAKNVDRAKVWCLEVEDDHSFVFPNGIVTGNCTYSPVDRMSFFGETMYLLLCGCGVGFSVEFENINQLPDIKEPSFTEIIHHTIDDSIEGWADAIKELMNSYEQGYTVEFIYKKIRKQGASIKTGGKAPGHIPLRRAIEKIRIIMDGAVGRKLKTIEAYDIIMHSSDAVLAGGVRRSATICLFSPDDILMMNSKTGNWFDDNPQRARSNNSVKLVRSETSREQFMRIFETQKESGEPGFYFVNNTDTGTNPCVEIGLNPYLSEGYKMPDGEVLAEKKSGFQFCNLTSINGSSLTSAKEFEIAVKAASIIGTCQAGYTIFEYLGKYTEEVCRRESLLGISITGMMDSPEIALNPELQQKMVKVAIRMNKRIAKKIGIPQAARVTCVKPEGTTSILLNTASGIHPRYAKKYFRRIQANVNDPVYQHFKEQNPECCERSVWSTNGTDDVITFCVEAPKNAITKEQVSAIEFLKIVKSTQENWVIPGTALPDSTVGLHHNVSNTCIVKDSEWDEVADFIFDNREFFTGVALLSDSGETMYQQAPHQTIRTNDDEADWSNFLESYEKVDYTQLSEEVDNTIHKDIIACAGGQCELP